MDVPFTLYQLAAAFIAAIWGISYLIKSSRAQKLPPSPRGLPVLGHALQVPRQHIGSYFRTLIRTYGPLVSLNLAGTSVLLIGDAKMAQVIMDKHSAKFSSRPNILYVERYFDPDGSYWAFHGQTEAFYIGRKLTTGVMTSVRAGKTEQLHRFETLLTVQHLLRNSEDAMGLIKRLIGSTVLTAAFGLHCPTGKEYELLEAIFLVDQVTALCNLPACIINFFPFLDWIPGRMPWRVRTEEFHKRHNDFYSKMITDAVSGKYAGMYTWASEFASEDKPEGDQSRFMGQFAGASIETTTSTILTFILAALVYPEWVRTAQKELDDIVGPDRLPTFADRKNLPYIEAVLRETLRWRPPGRSGIPHMSTEDDVVECNGVQYFIPAGTYVFAVSWAIEHDPERYAKPDEFDPKRHLDEADALRADYITSTFGHGRRVCPGSPFAERAIWMSIAMLLWTVNIQKSKVPDPVTNLPFQYDISDAAFDGGLANGPHDFPAVFVPRSERHAEVARQEWEDCEKDLHVLLRKAT